MTMLLLAATLFIAEPFDGTPAQRHERDVDQRIDLPAGDPPKSVFRVDGAAAVHLQTALTCPRNIGDYARDKLAAYDGFGLDVGCRYASGHDRIAVFLTMRTGQALADDFDAARAALAARAGGIRELAAGDDPLKGAAGVMSASYVVHGSASIERVWAMDLNGWTLVYRATYHGGGVEANHKAIAGLHDVVQRSAGGHLEACAAAAPVERSGVRENDARMIQRLVLIGGLSTQAADEPAAKATPQRWCVESAIRDPQTPMLFWRNVLERPARDDSVTGLGPGGPVDRFTLMTVEDPPTWIVEADTGANLLIDKPGSGAPIVHALIRREGYLTSMFAFFRGRPAMSALAPLVRDIALGKARPVATANAKSGAVSIPKRSQ